MVAVAVADGLSVRESNEGPDEEIVALARRGGADALRRAASAALRRYLRDLYGHVRARLPGDKAAVEDVLQEVALAVVEDLPRVRSGSALRSWLLGIASHKVFDHLRRRRRDRLSLEGDLGAVVFEHLVDEEGTLDRLLERAREEQVAAYVRRTLDRLKPHQREAVRLVYFEGLTMEAAGAQLKLRPDAVASLLYRARRTFGKLIERDCRAAAGRRPVSAPIEAVRKC